ncbi:MAG: HDOD domain-containing protein [Phycisphaerales bacterium]|nr:HDOD domain-containing protein [Phycisphaerales bacterium]MCB9837349.1 HDOD domain-containing protein [Phycisphaera sp.]
MEGSQSQGGSQKVELILERIDQLPTLSPIAQKLLDAATNDDVDIAELSALIETDPSLTGKVLSLCRRSDRGVSETVTNVQHAVTLVGLEAIQSAVLSVEVYSLMSGAESDVSTVGFDGQGHWRACISVASASELIAQALRLPKVRSETAFTAGLLHGIGRSALNLALPGSYGKVLRIAEQRGVDSARLERELIGLDHQAAGRRLAEHWGLPLMMQDVAWLYDMPAESVPDLQHRKLIGIVACARALCRRMNLGWFGDFAQAPDVGEIARGFGLDEAAIESVATRVHERVAERCGALGMDEISPVEVLLESVTRANARLASLNRSLANRSDHGSQQKKILDTIGDFCEKSRTSAGLAGAMAQIARSAADLIGGELFTIVTQSERGEQWRMFRFTETGTLVRSEVLAAPILEPGRRASLTMLTDPSQALTSGIKIMGFLAQYATENVEMDQIRILPLITGEDAEDRPAQCALLFVEKDFERAIPSSVQRRAVLSVWGSAVASALRHEFARKLSDELADRHRDLAETQAKLAETQSMARLGVMTAGAAHEMNNPLTVIKGYAQVLRSRVADSELRKLAEKMGVAAQEISDLISSMNLIADPPEPEMERCSIQGIINEAVVATRERTRMNCASRISIPPGMPVALLDPQLLRSALIELIANAAESGTTEIIEIRVQIDQLDDRLLVMIKDHGSGMPQKTLDHAFDPFFSEKPAGRQTGLGLFRARRLVELMGGSVSLSSREGIGTRALLMLPTWRAPELERETSKAA